MIIKSSERVAIVGKTGSGKSYLTKRLSQQFNRVIFVDPKNEHAEDLKNTYTHLVGSPEEVIEITDKEKEFYIVWQPEDLTENIWDDFCREVYQRGNLTVIVDETTYVCFPKATKWHGKILRMGRSLDISMWHLTQRPMFIDNSVLSEAEHFFIFHFQLPSDRKKMEGIIGEDIDELMDQLGEFEFIYYNPKEGSKIFEKID